VLRDAEGHSLSPWETPVSYSDIPDSRIPIYPRLVRRGRYLVNAKAPNKSTNETKSQRNQTRETRSCSGRREACRISQTGANRYLNL